MTDPDKGPAGADATPADSGHPTRANAQVIYARVREDAEHELQRPARSLAFSALFAGFTIGASPLAMALTTASIDGGAAKFVAALVYPIGFVAVIVGRAQLFTENTLYPVVASLEERRYVGPTARLWAIVFTANLIGGLLFALLMTKGGALPADVGHELTMLGEEAVAGSFGAVFASAVIAGWLLALVAWLVEAAEATIGQVLVIWSLTFLLGLGAFDHSVASAVDVFAAAIEGGVGIGALLGWLLAATLGNIVGGVLIVALLTYAQVTPEVD
ncbi:MAG: formate/nitrite transporter family protein [Thermoleophilaceae bacterium]